MHNSLHWPSKPCGRPWPNFPCFLAWPCPNWNPYCKTVALYFLVYKCFISLWHKNKIEFYNFMPQMVTFNPKGVIIILPGANDVISLRRPKISSLGVRPGKLKLKKLTLFFIQSTSFEPCVLLKALYKFAVLGGFVCTYHPGAPGSNPKHTIFAFFNL